MKTLVLANQKGGVGKSAVGTQLSYYLAKIGIRVLYLDFDHQKHSTTPITLSNKAVLAAFSTTQILAGEKLELPASNFVLVPADATLSKLDRVALQHEESFVANLKSYLEENNKNFDVCIVDTNPNPDVRYGAALRVADYVISPIQLNQEALSGVGMLLNDEAYGLNKLKETKNKKLVFLGLLPNIVEPTPFQRGNFEQLWRSHSSLLMLLDKEKNKFAMIAKRSSIAEAQAAGQALFEMNKTAAKEAWKEIKPVFDKIAELMKLEIK